MRHDASRYSYSLEIAAALVCIASALVYPLLCIAQTSIQPKVANSAQMQPMWTCNCFARCAVLNSCAARAVNRCAAPVPGSAALRSIRAERAQVALWRASRICCSHVSLESQLMTHP